MPLGLQTSARAPMREPGPYVYRHEKYMLPADVPRFCRQSFFFFPFTDNRWLGLKPSVGRNVDTQATCKGVHLFRL